MNKFVFILIFTFSLLNSFSQISLENHLEFYALPLVSNSHLFKEKNVIIQDNRIFFEENYTINSEVGLNLFLIKYRGLKFGLGTSYKSYSYSFSSIFEKFSPIIEDSEVKEFSGYYYKNNININALGIRGLVRINFMKSTSITFVLEFNKPISVKSAYTIKDGNFGTLDYEYNEKLNPNIMSIDHYIIPELNFNTRLHEKLFLHYGFKLRFWKGKENLYEFKIHTDNGGFENYTLLDYQINTRQIGFFIGLNYQFQKKN
jgi:hypothetical protein